MPLHGFIGTVHPVAVELAGLHVGKVGVPDLIGVFLEYDASRFHRVVRGVEQAELDLGRILGEQGEVDAGAVPRRSQRIRPPRPHSHGWDHRTLVTQTTCRGQWIEMTRSSAPSRAES